jgi:acyl-CoA synthetase (AMP-forming)/AMP-acid ligase II
MIIGEALPRNAQHFPDKPAIVDQRKSVTHLQLHLRTNRLGNYLIQQGIRRGDRVAVSCGSRSEHFEMLFGLAKIGAIAVPFDYNWSPGECAAMLKFFKPSAFILEHRNQTQELFGIARERIAADRLLAIDCPSSEGNTPYEEALACAPDNDPEIPVDGKDIFLVMITSGTTGFPKGCQVNHETYALRSINNAITKGLSADERALITLPLHFNAGRGSMMGMLYLGGSVFIQERFNEEKFLSTIQQERITYTILVPTLCDRLLRYPRLDEFDKSSLGYLGITGGHLSREVAAGVMRRICPYLYESYASTDCGQITIIDPQDRESYSETVGKPIWCVLLKIADEAGQELPRGQEGEICVRTPLAIQGYYNNPEATEDFFSGGWCHTGDIGFLDDNGYLTVSGRKKNMVKSGGISVFPEEIEDVLRKHPQVADVAVVGYKSPEWGEAVKAFVVPNGRSDRDADSLIRFCKESLASYKAPKAIEFIAELPRTGLGKIDRGKLAAMTGQTRSS